MIFDAFALPSRCGGFIFVISLSRKRGGPLDRTEDIVTLRPWNGGSTAGRDETSNTPAPKPPERVAFDRRELQTILGFYGTKVAEGEWRDYAIDFMKDRAVFSVFRRASEVPLYRIEKNPKLARKQGAYSVLAPAGLPAALPTGPLVPLSAVVPLWREARQRVNSSENLR